MKNPAILHKISDEVGQSSVKSRSLWFSVKLANHARKDNLASLGDYP
jgi:hypothetical protein